MGNSFRVLCAAAFASILPACGPGGGAPTTPSAEMAIDQRPEFIARTKDNWRVHDGGIAERSGGLVIDIAEGGILRRDVERDVSRKTELELVMNLDANGAQSLTVRLAGGCGRDPAASETIDSLALKNGFNRVTVSNQFKANHDCFITELWAQNGPVSLFIEDASFYWKEIDEPRK